MHGANGHRKVVAIDDVVQELRYTLWAGFVFRQAKGKCAPAQDVALERGWLQPSADIHELRLTPAGRIELARHSA